MDDLIIACSSGYDWDVLKYWCNSLNRSGFQGKKVVLLVEGSKETVQKITDGGIDVEVIGLDSNGNPTHPKTNIPPHVMRFGYLYDFLAKNSYRYVVTTDIRDVIFQKNPINWIENNIKDKQYIFSSESIKYLDEPWGNQNLFETYGQYFYDQFKQNEIFNVGVLAGKCNSIKALCANIFTSATTKPIPICDQSTFNFMVGQEPYLSTSVYTRSEDGWACQLGTTGDPLKINFFAPKLLEPIPVAKDGVVYTSTGTPFTIVHQYDRIFTLKTMIEEIYSE